MIHDGKNPPYPIQLRDLEAKYAEGVIDWPQLTEIEIQDRSKGDALSKGIVVFQTSWFFVQCIGRQCVGLAITELELVTLAFAALNIVTYFFWWNKPVDVRCPHLIYLNGRTSHVEEISDTTSSLSSSSSHSAGYLFGRAISFLWSCLRPFIPPINPFRHPGARFFVALACIQRPVAPLLKFLVKGALAIKGHRTRSTRGRVPTLYAAQLDSNPTVFFLMTLMCALFGGVFGGIHCIAWWFQFPSRRDQFLWRASSLVITCTPLAIALISNDMSHMEDDTLKFWVNPAHRPVDGLRPRSPIVFESSITSITYVDPSAELPSPIHPPPTATTSPGLMSYEIDRQIRDVLDPTSYTPTIPSQLRHSTTTINGAVSHSRVPVYCSGPVSIQPRSPLPSIQQSRSSMWHNWHTTLSALVFNVKGILLGTSIIRNSHPGRSHYTTWRYALMTLVWITKCILLAGLTSAYTAARIILLVQALMALKTLSPGTLQTMEWTNFIPHI